MGRKYVGDRLHGTTGKFVTSYVLALHSYIFVQLSAESGGVRTVNSTRSIAKFVIVGQELAIVHTGPVAVLRTWFAPPPTSHLRYSLTQATMPGSYGPFAEFVAEGDAPTAA